MTICNVVNQSFCFWNTIWKYTKDPKSVWAPIALFLSSCGIGGLLIILASDPLCSSTECNNSKVPFGSPSLSLKIFMIVALTSNDRRTKGWMTVGMFWSNNSGYFRLTWEGQARTSSLERFQNSTVSFSPLASTAFEPFGLYLCYRNHVVSFSWDAFENED
jgi:hypothetical protein